MRVGAKQLVEQQPAAAPRTREACIGVTTGTQPAALTMVLDDQADLV
jgi:hypothetical protein